VAEPSRPRAHDIYERVREDAAAELERSAVSLGYSGLFAGFTLGAAPLAVALALSILGDAQGAMLVAALLYPVGYLAVILGRAQFFTENTLYPVLLSLQDRTAVRGTLRLWVIVFATNIVGALIFALLATEAGVLDPGTQQAFVTLGTEDAAGSFGENFWSAVITGWLLATVAWLVEATETAVGQILAIWSLTMLVALGSFDHCIASTIDVASATFDGQVDVNRLLGWLGTAVLGNTVGGVFIVSVLNYGQARYEEE
jgi:formate-nitrite transporter family protein